MIPYIQASYKIASNIGIIEKYGFHILTTDISHGNIAIYVISPNDITHPDTGVDDDEKE
jgi:hypothetical protein